jgi:arylsulfatase A
MIKLKKSIVFPRIGIGYWPVFILLLLFSVSLASFTERSTAPDKPNVTRGNAAPGTPDRPNIVFILADDLGYTDLGCYGAKEIKTPNLDKLASQGVRFTDFYAPAGVCTPTRASLMTGSYPKRVGLHVAVLPPDTHSGLNPSEKTIAELLKEQGYTTGAIGKWHLGLLPEVKPNAQGFDYYYGMPGPNHGRSDLYRNTELLKKNSEVEYDQITQDYTREAVSFIRQNKDKPFFLYLPHSAIHIPLYASKEFRRHEGTNGLYRDMTEELDWSCGEILKELEAAGIMDNTIVVFTSDNGPSGVAAPPLHGGKGSSWEAGFRVPLIVRWPGHIPAGSVCRELATMMDFYPTLAKLTGAQVPPDRKIDGHDIFPLLTRKKAKSPYDFLCYYGRTGQLYAIRKGKWKLHFLAPDEKWAGKQPVQEALLDTKPTTALPWLYDLSTDIGETKNVAADHARIVAELTAAAQSFDNTLTAEIRPAYVEK